MRTLQPTPSELTSPAPRVEPRPATVRRVDVLGVPVDAHDAASLVEAVERLIARGGGAILAPVNIEVINRALADPALLAFLRKADVVHADGEGPVLASRILGDPLPCRVTSIRLIWALCERWSAGQRSIYFLGGPPGYAEAAVAAIHARYPGVRFAGTHRGHLTEEEERTVVAEILRVKPDLLCVGFGTPYQEHFIERYRAAFAPIPLTWPVGALTTHVARIVPRAPRLMRRTGFEWLWRLILEPRRLWRRYLVGNVVFTWRVLVARARHGRRSSAGVVA